MSTGTTRDLPSDNASAGAQTAEHRCRQGTECAAWVLTADGRRVGAGIETPNALCRVCEARAFAAVRELRDDYGLLEDARTDTPSRLTGPKVSGSGSPSIPLNLAADTLAEDIDTEALRWTLRITRGDPLPTPTGQRVRICLRVIRANLGTLIDMPRQVTAAYFPYPEGGDWDGRLELDGVDAVLRLAALHYRAVKILGLEAPREEWLPESCHVCGRRTVFSVLSCALIKCRSCHNVWDQDVFAALNNPLVAA